MKFLRLVFLLLPVFTCHLTQGQIKPLHERRTIGEDTAFIGTLLAQAKSCRHQFTDSGIALYQEAFIKSREIGYNDGMARALIGLGLFHMDKGAYNKSAAYYRLAEPFCRASKRKSGIALANLYNNVAALYGNRGIHDSAVTYYYKALNLFETKQIRDTNMLLLIYSNIGGRLAMSGQTEQSEFYLEKGILIAKRTRNTLMLAKFYKDLGILYGINKQPARSRHYSLKALELFKNLNDPPSELVTYCNVGQSYLDEGKPQEAQRYYRMALNDSIEASPLQRTAAIRGLGASYLARKNYPAAKDFYLQALAISQKERVNKSMLDCYKALVSVYAGLGDFEQALKYKDAFDALEDSTINADRLEKVQQLEVEYRTAQKDKDLAQKQLQLQQKENLIQQKNRLIIAIIAGALMLIILLGTLYKNYRHRQKIKLMRLENDRKITQLKAVTEGEEKERARIARELHDGIMVQFSAAQMNLSALMEKNSMAQSAELEKILRQLEDATQELRKSAHNLMPDMLLKEGLAEAAHYFCKTMERSTGIKIHFQVIGTMPAIAPVYELMVYRTIQELLQNTAKHAQATDVLVQINCQEDMISMLVEDNGKGFDPQQLSNNSGMGLAGIESRVKSLQGQMTVSTHRDTGTSVYIELETQYLQTIRPVAHAD